MLVVAYRAVLKLRMQQKPSLTLKGVVIVRDGPADKSIHVHAAAITA